MADYTIPGQSSIPPPPTSGTVSGGDAPLPKPQITEISLTAKRLVFTESPRKGTVEWTAGMTAVPDAGFPASASLDRLRLALATKLDEYLQGVG